MLKALYDKKKAKKSIAKKSSSEANPELQAQTRGQGKRKRELGDMAGSQFRWLNDMLYSTSSDQAFSEFTKDPDLFSVYHAGFSRQAEKWPTNPVDVCLDFLRRHSKQLRAVGDFGCGEAQIAKELAGERSVHSFDLVSNGNPSITPCNISRVPLAAASLDVAIFNLSLMGTDWPLFVAEARRCLKTGGLLYISEVVSRLASGVQAFEAALEAAGFRMLRSLPSQGNYFHTFVAKKTTAKTLRPMDSSLLGRCQYKKR